MTSLKHLQIAIPARRRNINLTGFDVCPSLESLCLFGLPDATTIAELNNLPNLKTLTVVENLESEKTVDNLKQALPGVEVSMVKFGDHLNSIPQSFMEHFSRVQRTLKAKIFGEKVDSQ